MLSWVKVVPRLGLYTSIPPKYYLKRRTKTIVDDIVLDLHGDPILKDIDHFATARYSELSHISQRIITKSAKSKQVFSWTKLALLEVDSMVDKWISLEEKGSLKMKKTAQIHENSPPTLQVDVSLKHAPVRRCRGQHKKRIKSCLETRRVKKNLSKEKG